MDGTRPGIGDAAMSPAMGAQSGEILTALINEIAEIEDDFVLGIDDYHVITEVPISDDAAVVEWMLVLAWERVI